MNTLKDRWEEYRRTVIVKTAGPVQIRETRRGFYAGATSMLSILVDAIGDQLPEIEPAAIELMRTIQSELDEFVDGIGPGGN